MKVYGFLYTDCFYESAAYTVSLHKTKKGAEMAMEFHKVEEKKKYDELGWTKEEKEQYPFGSHEQWFIEEFNVKE